MTQAIYEGDSESYADAKFKTLVATLSAVAGIEVSEDKDAMRVYKDGALIATIEISI